jgi:CRISPR type III-B/RAMP module RAMP protein Cmr1
MSRLQQANWFKVQQDLIEKDLIAEFEVETITYTRIGGYKATPFSYDLKLLNKNIAKSLKGVWRWWARVAITGAFNGKISYEEANEYLSKIFGGPKEHKSISLYQLEISNLSLNLKKWDEYVKIINNVYDKIIQEIKSGKESIKISDYLQKNITNRDIVEFLQIPRIKLLLMPRKEEGEEDRVDIDNIDNEKIKRYLNRIKEEILTLITKGIKFTIKIYGDKDKDKSDFAISTFILALILGGIGSITKRGFGSLKILNYKIDNKVIDDKIINNINKLKDKNQIDEKSLKTVLNELVGLSLNSAIKLFKIKVSDTVKLPEVPSMMSNDYFKIEVLKVRESKGINEIMKKIGEAFLKQSWKRYPSERDGKYHTWILGLPRYRERTGYYVKINHKDKGDIRRISSIGVRLYENSGLLFIILYGFLSKDWPLKNLYHKGGKSKPLLVKYSQIIDPTDPTKIKPRIDGEEEFLKEIFNIAFNTIIKKLEKI